MENIDLIGMGLVKKFFLRPLPGPSWKSGILQKVYPTKAY